MKSQINVAHVHLETQLVLSEDFVQVLIVENPAEFYSMVSDLDSQFDGGEGLFVFSRNGQMIDPVKCGAMVSDVFHFDLNDKKILNLLYKRLERVAFGEQLPLFNRLTTSTVSFLEELSFSTPFLLEYDEPQPTDYFKSAGLKFPKNHDSLVEKVVCYVNVLIELKKCDFFVFVNLQSVLSVDALQQFYAHCQQEQVGLLLIECSKRRNALPQEKVVLVTEDLCELLENYQDSC